MDGQVEGYAHDIVERAEQTGAAGAAIVVDEVEGTLADEVGDGVFGRDGVGSHASVAIAGDAGVGVDFVDDAAVDAVEVDSAGGVAGGEFGGDGDDFDVGDLHGALLAGGGAKAYYEVGLKIGGWR